MYRTLIIFIFLFSACSFKNPIKKDDLEEANSCKLNRSMEKKLLCYKSIVDNNSYAQLRLGTYYADKNDYNKAIELLEKSYNSDNIHANTALAYLYYNGFGIKKDIKKAEALLEEVSDRDANAAYRLANIYLNNKEKEKNTKAIELLEFAASKSMKFSIVKLSEIYSNGLYRIQKDYKKAKFWNEKLKSIKKDTTFDIYKL